MVALRARKDSRPSVTLLPPCSPIMLRCSPLHPHWPIYCPSKRPAYSHLRAFAIDLPLPETSFLQIATGLNSLLPIAHLHICHLIKKVFLDPLI